jgi:hypothetical protein
MNRKRVAGAFSVAILIMISAQSAQAQYYPPYQRPGYSSQAYTPNTGAMLSPYLALRGGNNPAINYYLRVLPEEQRREQYNQISSQIQDLERRQAQPPTTEEALVPMLMETGHPVQFLGVAPYYTYSGFAPRSAQPGSLPTTSVPRVR